jgi:hypothetical protein
VVKHVDAVELRVVVIAVLAVAADVVLVAQHLLKIRAHLATALAKTGPPACAKSRAKKQPGGGEHSRYLIGVCRYIYRQQR